MKRLTHIISMCGMVPLLGLALLASPQPAHAHGVTVGIGVPAPVVVAPAPVVVVRRGHYRHSRRHYYWRYYPGSSYRSPHRHWRHHHHSWHRW
jgi:hypothetical protein